MDAGRRPRLAEGAQRSGLVVVAVLAATVFELFACSSPAGAASPAPTTPTGLTAAAGIGGLALSWDAVAPPSGRPVSYKVSSRPPGKGCTTSATSCFVPIADTTPWTFVVQARSGSKSSVPSQPSSPVPTRVVLLVAGQSNAVGMDDPSSPVDYLADPNLTAADALDQMLWLSGPSPQLNLGTIDVDQQVGISHRVMGPEVGLARTLMADRGEAVVIVKHAIAGSFLACPDFIGWPCWGDGAQGTQLATLIAGTRSALAQLEAQGTLGVVGGLFWMQGESDAVVSAHARAYKGNLTRLIRSLRSTLPSAKAMAIIIAKPDITLRLDADLAEGTSAAVVEHGRQGNATVRSAIDAVASRQPAVAVIDTADLARVLWDPIHVTAAGEIELGQRMARAAEPLMP